MVSKQVYRYHCSWLLSILICVGRRAKLKRLTTDDQERMRRSRALPENFDFSQTLQPRYGSALTEPSIFGGNMSQRPSLRLGTGHLSMALNSMDSIFTNNAPSPVSTMGSANPSPVSSTKEGSERSGPYFSATQSSHVTNSRFTNPFCRSHTLSADSPAFQRQDGPSSQNSTMGLGGQSNANTSSSNPSLANNSYGHGNLPPLQFTRTPFQTRDGQSFGRIPTTEGLSHGSGIAMNQPFISPLSSPHTLSYDPSQTLYPSGSGYRASSYDPSPDSSLWQSSPMSAQKYQYGQHLQPHQTTEQRPGSQSWQSSLSPDPWVNRYDQRSYSHSGQYYSPMSSSTPEMSSESDVHGQGRILRAGGATGPDTQARPDAARPRARSDTFPAYYNAQKWATSPVG